VSTKCIEKLPHRTDKCNSSSGLQVFAKEGGGYDGYCFACGEYIPNPYGDKPEGYKPKVSIKSDEEIQAELDEVEEYQTVDLPKRKLRKESLEYFGIKIGLSETDGTTPHSHYYPYYKGGKLIGYKVRLIEDKRMWAIGSTKEADFFGWNQAVLAGGKKLFITEGECFTPDTQVLTPNGWVRLDEWDGQYVMTGSGEYELPSWQVKKHYEGNLVEYSSGSYKSSMTPEHNMLRVKDGKWIKVKAGDSKKKYLPVPRTVDYNSYANTLATRAQVMLSADFTFRKEGDLYGAFKKTRKVERAKEILDELGVRYVINKVKGGYYSIFIHREHGLDVSKLFSYSRDLRSARTVINEIVHWDGNSVPDRDQIEYATKELHNAEFVQTCAHLCGYVSTIIRRSNKYGNWYKVSILFGKQTSSTQKGFKEIPYKGEVYCLTVPSGTLLVKYKESISVSGNCDAVALFQIFKDKNKATQYADMNPAIVSVSNGAGGAAKQISRMLPEIRKQFKEVILVFDNDEPGKKAVEDVLKILPDALVASIPSKDANQALIDGRSIATYNACQFNAQKPKNTRLIYASSLHEAAKERPKMGFSWPWSHLTKATRGLRFGETIYLGAPQKMGKSDVVNTLAAHFIKEHGWKVFLIKPEEENKRTYKMVAGKLVGKFFHDPNKEFDEDSFEEAGAIIQDNLILLNLYQAVDWETTKTDIRAAVAEGVKAVFLDPLTNYSNGMSAADANVLLQKIAQEAAALALDLNIVMFLTCHVRNPESGIPHELGGHVLSNQMAGSRAMARSCHLLLGLEGNRDPNLPAEERNMRQIVILEDRNFGENGRFKLYWDNNTGLFQEINH